MFEDYQFGRHEVNRAQQNNNPCNLRFAHQAEATGQDDKGFAIFPSAEAGFRAAHAQIKLDQERGLTVGQFIGKYAPPNENNTSQYLQFVCVNLRCKPTDPLNQLSQWALAGAMAQEEGYYDKS